MVGPPECCPGLKLPGTGDLWLSRPGQAGPECAWACCVTHGGYEPRHAAVRERSGLGVRSVSKANSRGHALMPIKCLPKLATYLCSNSDMLEGPSVSQAQVQIPIMVPS